MSLRTLVRTSKAVGEFRRIEARLPQRFTDPLALVEFLASRESDQDEREAIYRVIVSAAQIGSHFAVVVLWLGLWAALDSIYRKNCRRYGDHPQELVADLGGCFMEAIMAARLDHIQRLAATLVMNTERRMTAAAVRQAERSAQEGDLPEDDTKAALKTPEGPQPDQQVEALRSWLTAHVPKDAELLTETILNGETQKAFAERKGLSHDSIRKRHQRALNELRTVSHFEGFDRVYRVRGKKPAPRRARR